MDEKVIKAKSNKAFTSSKTSCHYAIHISQLSHAINLNFVPLNQSEFDF